MVLRDLVNEDFFLRKFKEKFVNKLFIEQMKKDFLELKKGKIAVFKYEKEFIRISKYTKDLVPDEEGLRIRFEGGLKEELRVLLFALEIRDFAVSFAKAQRMEATIQERNRIRDRKMREHVASSAC